jgi:DNA-binding response OmpR family regulator
MNMIALSRVLVVDKSTEFGSSPLLTDEVAKALRPHYHNMILSNEINFWNHLKQGVDLVFLEYSVTDMSGILLFKKMSLLPEFSLIPVIFVSKTKAYDHRVNAFEMGAADFLVAPFNDERVLEMAASQLLNCRRFLPDGSVKIANMQFHPSSRSVWVDGQKVKLTDLEFKILQYLLITPRNVITRTEICQHVWGSEMVNTGRLDTQLYNLKKKISAFNGKIKSVNKIGMRVLAGDTTFYQAPQKPVLQSLHPELRSL